MTDEERNATQTRPVAPRHKLPTNPMMAQPTTKRRPKDAEIETIPSLDAQPADAAPAPELAPATERPPAPKAQPAAPPKPPVVQEALPVAAAAAMDPGPPEPAAPAHESIPPGAEDDFPRTIRDTLRVVDQSWAAFHAAAQRFPYERMNEAIGEHGWTRKQMLAHIAAWHDLTADRLLKLVNTGDLEPLDRDTDKFNATVARQSVGKTMGEVLKDLDTTFNRLRWQLSRMSDEQLEANDWFAAQVVGGNTYGHYEEHWADIESSGPARR